MDMVGFGGTRRTGDPGIWIRSRASRQVSSGRPRPASAGWPWCRTRSARLRPAGIDVLVESGAGDGAWLPDAAYADAGASIVSAAELYRTADVILTVTRPSAEALERAQEGPGGHRHAGPAGRPRAGRGAGRPGVTAISLDGLPRTLTRAQPMDALTSQANVAGYKAALVAAAEFGRFFPLLITAAGTARPAKVLVLGAGVAGLQAIGTARRLGAVVSGYDVRPSSKDEVESLGRHVHRADLGRLRGGRGRLRPRADRRGAAGPAGRADRPHRPARRGDHHRAGARAQAAAAGDRGRGQGHVAPARSSSTWAPARSAATCPARSPARRSSPATGSRSSARTTCPPPCRPRRRPRTRGTSPRCCCT